MEHFLDLYTSRSSSHKENAQNIEELGIYAGSFSLNAIRDLERRDDVDIVESDNEMKLMYEEMEKEICSGNSTLNSTENSTKEPFLDEGMFNSYFGSIRPPQQGEEKQNLTGTQLWNLDTIDQRSGPLDGKFIYNNASGYASHTSSIFGRLPPQSNCSNRYECYIWLIHGKQLEYHCLCYRFGETKFYKIPFAKLTWLSYWYRV